MALRSELIERLRATAERQGAKLANIARQNETMVGHLSQTATVNVATYALGFASGAWGDQNGTLAIKGVPVDLTLGILTQGLAFWSGNAKGNEILHNLGDAMLSHYSARAGFGHGARWRAGAGQQSAPAPVQAPQQELRPDAPPTAAGWGGYPMMPGYYAPPILPQAPAPTYAGASPSAEEALASMYGLR